MQIDKDITTNYSDELYIAFCGSDTLTEKGIKHFAPILNNKVEFKHKYTAIINCENDKELNLLIELFHMLAGYSSTEKHNKFVKENE